MIDENFVEDEAGWDLPGQYLEPGTHKTAALPQPGVTVASGSPAVCLEWSSARALAAAATNDDVADVLRAIATVAGLGRAVCAGPDVATALGYDGVAALEDPDDP